MEELSDQGITVTKASAKTGTQVEQIFQLLTKKMMEA
jgi:plasmid replication initiation protein